MGNLLGLVEILIFLGLFEGIALTITIYGLINASLLWEMLDARVAAAAEFSIGLETELTWDKAIKATTLCLL